MLVTKHMIRREVESITKHLTDRQLFSSKEFGELLQATVTALGSRLGRIPTLTAVYDPSSDFTANTNGTHININTASPLVRELDTRWKKYVCLVGHATHEMGHVLYSDTHNRNTRVFGWLKSHEFVFWPAVVSDEAAKIVEIMNSYPVIRRYYGNAMLHMDNILEDIFIENMMYANCGGLAAAGMTLANDEIKRKATYSIDTLMEKVVAGSLPKLAAALSLLQLDKLGHKLPLARPLTEAEQEVYDSIESALNDCAVITKKLEFERNGMQRQILYNQMYIKMFKLMDTDEDSLAAMNNDMANDMLNETKEMMSEMGETEMTEGDSKPVRSKAIKVEEVDGSKKTAKALAENDEIMSRESDVATKDVATEMASEKLDGKRVSELRDEARKIAREMNTDEKPRKDVEYNIFTPKSDKTDYESYVKRNSWLISTAEILVRKVNYVLKCRDYDSYESGYYTGNKFEGKKAYRKDKRVFGRRVVPDGTPDVAIAILIDESGSMRTNLNYQKAKNAAIIFEHALRKLNVAHMIVGHDTYRDYQSNIYSYIDFDQFYERNKYDLCSISGRSGNCDGAAITYCCEKLLARPEASKLLLVISDGEPTETSYYHSDAVKDTMTAIEKYRKKKIKIFAGVLDSVDDVRNLYGEKYSFDCVDKNNLIVQFTKLVQRYILETK